MKAPMRYYQSRRARYELPDREWLEHEYWGLNKSLNEIAIEIGGSLCRQTIQHWLRRFGIPARTRQDRNERHSHRMSGSGNPAWNGGTAQNYHARVVAKRPHICEWCGTTEKVQVHHRDHNKRNGDPDNLGFLCGTCNRLEAGLRALQERGRANVLVDKTEHRIEIRFLSL